jgi:hypothetical protein
MSPDHTFDLGTSLALSSPIEILPETMVDTLDVYSQEILSPSLPLPFALDLSSNPTLDYSLNGLTRSLSRRRLARPQLQVCANLMIQIFASFPAAMLQKETFPPFIHPRSFSAIPGKEYQIPEALINCMSLAQLFKSRTQENSKFLWKCIRIEHERLWKEVSIGSQLLRSV